MERIGIYGGTFNPPHIGHLQAVRQAAASLSLDKVLVIPDRIAPHKQMPHNSATGEQRLEMLRIAARGCPELEVSDIELRREGVSYTWQTVEQLKALYPEAELVLLMGTDNFLSFSTWKHPERILEYATLGVFFRGDRAERERTQAYRAQLLSQGHKVELVENDVIAISSTQLRRLLAFRCSGVYLPEGVLDYIREHRLYDTRADWKQLSLDELEEVTVSLLDHKRVDHVLGCRDTAVALAKRWGADETDAARAALLHDITKAIDGPLQLTLCEAYGKILDAFSRKYPKTLHAYTGSLVAERIFGENEAVVNAIAHHTTGKPHMNLLETIIYVADYMEPNRDFPGVERLRQLAFTDLRAALKLGLEMTLEHLQRQGSEVSPQTRETLAWLNQSV